MNFYIKQNISIADLAVSPKLKLKPRKILMEQSFKLLHLSISSVTIMELVNASLPWQIKSKKKSG